MESWIEVLLYGLAGTLLGGFLFVVPSIHFLNFSGVIIALWGHYHGLFPIEEPLTLFAFFMGDGGLLRDHEYYPLDVFRGAG